MTHIRLFLEMKLWTEQGERTQRDEEWVHHHKYIAVREIILESNRGCYQEEYVSALQAHLEIMYIFGQMYILICFLAETLYVDYKQ